ncbi:SurA N-terminal domain-containing protein [Planctomycetota bacterium]|nr:SurA N-terminal domain-containing protein [Planctomycetota bacterium]
MKRFYKRLISALLVLLALPVVGVTDDNARIDGIDDILAIVNGKAITREEVLSGVNIEQEINTTRIVLRLGPEISDETIKKNLVYNRLDSIIIDHLLDEEADKLQIKVTDMQLRPMLHSEMKSLGMKTTDTRAWAAYLKQQYNQTPTEYKNRRKISMRRQTVLDYMAGQYGALPPDFPLEIYFSLSVTPKDIRKAYDEDPEKVRIARNIQYQRFRLLFPSSITSISDRQKLINAIQQPETGVYARVKKGESMKAASDGLEALIKELNIPGVKLDIGEETTAKDDTELDSTTYGMVLDTPEQGGLSSLGSIRETGKDGTVFEGIQFVKVIKWEAGETKNFEDPKVQKEFRDRLYNQKLVNNRDKVRRELIRRAAVIPEALLEQ